ncbi:MAG: DUF1080 domain-containing protein [Acidobacteriota bacterium]
MLKRFLCLFACLTVAPLAAQQPGPWKQMFDGKTLKGWKASERAENWKVEDGAIVGRGERSHLFYMEEECANCEFKAEVKINKGGNSGMYFRAEFGPGWPKGYEAQVNNSHGDWRRTGSLYGIKDVKEQLIPDDTWWTQHIIADGNHITIKVNDKVVVDYVDEKNTFAKGHLALQQHDPGSVVQYRNLQMRRLP